MPDVDKMAEAATNVISRAEHIVSSIDKLKTAVERGTGVKLTIQETEALLFTINTLRAGVYKQESR